MVNDTSSESIALGTAFKSNTLSVELNATTKNSTCPMNQAYKKPLFLLQSTRMQKTVKIITAPNPVINVGIASASIGMFNVSNQSSS